ncbi:potassium-transporting ATPase subunit C [candidate division GN15 bacterium]|uniref:Potassium-transporting ATPase KdpC subunit n=1 Tax=candidate division GN15 bacterium TaxID=2072418 RepID=A0A855WX88_9BACT|nr:MAG: potassium-transporting ATPase subunit C [candidate division GN15 bacterium]
MKTLWIATRVLVVLTVLTGIIYPLMITGMSQVVFRRQAAGSMIEVGARTIGSRLVGQTFVSNRYFWPRPSATRYNSMPSGGSNLGPTSLALQDSVEARAARLGAPVAEIPADLLTASGSGLDPDISPEAALFQIDRVAKARRLSSEDQSRLQLLVRSHIKTLQFGLFGEPRVNVLELNLALDSLLQ